MAYGTVKSQFTEVRKVGEWIPPGSEVQIPNPRLAADEAKKNGTKITRIEALEKVENASMKLKREWIQNLLKKVEYVTAGRLGQNEC